MAERAHQAQGQAHLLHRITRVHTVLALAVPVFGLAVATQLDVLGDAWVRVAMALTVLAGILLAGVVVPGQRRLLHVVSAGSAQQADAGAVVTGAGQTLEAAALVRRLGMVSGVFNLVWVTVVVLMIVRPGSTTGV